MKDLTLPTPALPPLPAHDLYVDAFGELNPTDGRSFVMGNFFTAEQMQDYARAALSSHHEDGGRAATDKESARDAAFEQAANLVECEYAADATQGRRLAQIAQHIRDLKKRNQS